ncbi:hypothetical protein HY086_02945 [Candidatus Gottesmanbacteria bacterium]|nr:hypothetical protein [Candidatus Gottesmanbacteria bacterium]
MKHPRFVYRSWQIDASPSLLTVRFHFLLGPDINFSPEITIPINGPVDRSLIEPFVFNLGMVEAISYWKAACPPELVVEAGSLTADQIAWWHDLFLNGLGEFFYKNTVNFTQPNFLTIRTQPQQFNNVAIKQSSPSGDLILVGGGKDSAVTLELLKKMPQPKTALLLNPTPASLKIVEVAGYQEKIIVKRTIDLKLLELNKAGYLNGHTPFSAYLAFLGSLVAALYGFKNVIASNEASASEGNINYLGKTINHQYSKSYDFEKKFRDYSKEPTYFSFLRPLSELQIAALFATMPRYHQVFASCNVNRGLGWCGNCPKCAFVYLILSPFLSTKQLLNIFGSDFFDKPELQKHFLDLTGAGDKKPFDCVGTPQDVQGALSLLAGEPLELSDWNAKHFLPKEYEAVLRQALKNV